VGAGILVSRIQRSAGADAGAAPSEPIRFRAGAAGDEVAARLAAGIRTVSPTEREIREEVRTLMLANLATTLLASQLRFLQDDANTIRVFGVRQDSALGLLGFENGDAITSFGPGRGATAANALLALEAMKTGTVATIGMKRKGLPMEMRYRVAP